ncbi:transporter substrate-binding domain-containing protein [Stenotrophomonas sp. Sa5BUN4]|uniref:histidine kinase n=1 Tax=Stenotrophomonas lacuserhaii TaxID=2760084 RepID=A0A8X8FRD4_9GAMM|nr:transporter substrate-binding domain-containing protein [Stenotrophomonas pennii]MBD7953822.1 transporter substrate-binding domain-containing protein [Stenotrophomonas pennii]
MMRLGMMVGWLLALCCAASSALAHAQAPELTLTPKQRAWLHAHPVIRVGVYDNDWLPFEKVENARLSGFSPETLQAAATALGVRLEPRTYPSWEAVLEAACAGDIDVVMDVQLTSARTRCMVFTQKFAAAPLGMTARSSDRRSITSLDLVGLRIAVEDDQVTAVGVRDRYPRAQIVPASRTLAALKSVAREDADLYIGNAYVIQHLTKQKSLSGLTLLQPPDIPPMNLYFGVPNAAQPLAEALDVALNSLPEATRAALRVKWLTPLEWAVTPGLRFSPEETEALAQPIRLGVPLNWEPIAFRDKQGKPSGVAGDYLKRFVEAGARNLQIVEFEDGEALQRAMRDRTIDAALAVPMTNAAASAGWRFSEPFITIPNVILTHVGAPRVIDLRDLNHRRVVLSEPDRLGPLIKAQAPDVQLVTAADAATALKLLDGDGADAYVGNLAVVDPYLRDAYAGRLQIAAPAGTEDRLTLAAFGNSAALASAFDQVVGNVAAGERERIRNDWLGVGAQPAINWRRIMLWTLPALLILLTGSIVHTVGHMRLRREVSQRRIAENRLSRVTRKLPAIVYQVHRAPDGTFTFPYVAGDVFSLFGVELSDVLEDERAMFARVHPDDQQMLVEATELAAATGTGLSFQFRALSPEGWRWIYSKGELMERTETGTEWSGYWVDVTESHEASIALEDAIAVAEKAGKAKDEFLATMSHEIRTPMSSVAGMLEVLGHTGLDQEQSAILAKINRSSAVLRQLLNDTLDMSKIEAGALTLEWTAVDLANSVDTVHAMLAPQAAAKGLVLSATLAPAVASRVLADELRLQQILMNLTSNAIKFTAHGEVSIRVDVVADAVGEQRLAFSVTDSGIGIPADQLERIFEPFTQADLSTARKYGGTGLGLSISRRLADLMGGELELKSTPGLGTCAVLSLRLAVLPPEPATAGEVAPSGTGPIPLLPAPPPGRRWRVLVAEDDATSREIIQWRMGQLGVECVAVEDGAQALAAVRDGRFDLLVTDCQMPVMDGYTLAREIRASEGSARDLPIIALTASIFPDETALGASAGIEELLPKSASLNELGDAVARALRSRTDVTHPLQGEP